MCLFLQITQRACNSKCDVTKGVVYILDLESDICIIGPPIEVHIHIFALCLELMPKSNIYLNPKPWLKGLR